VSVNPQAAALLEAALDYARRGWRVMPLHNLTADGVCTCDGWRAEKGLAACRTPGKHPRFNKWEQLASADEKKIRAWWKSWPMANVGIATGRASGCLVLDTDPRNGGDWARGTLIEKHGKLPECPTCVTGGKGLHEHFRWPDGVENAPGMIEIEPGLEVLLENHNVVMPPSFAHARGEAYFWDIEPADELPPAPSWLVDIIKQRLQQPKAAGKKPDQGGAKWPLADVGAILRQCEWMRWTADNAKSLSEPEWYAQLAILGRCENGEQLAHELSSPHSGYNARETAKKLEHALRDAGPTTCNKVRHSLGGSRFCNQCAANVKSPILLGMPGRNEHRARPLDAATQRGDATDPQDSDAPPPAMHENRSDEAAQHTVLKAVDEVIEADRASKAEGGPGCLEQAYDLAPLIAAADSLTRAKAEARLEDYFGGRLKSRRLAKVISIAIKDRTKRAAAAGGESGGGRPPWTSLLLRAGNGQPRANLANAITAFRHAPEWEGVIWRDEFAEMTWAKKAPPTGAPEGKWGNRHDVLAADWLQHHDIDVSIEIAGRAAEAVGYERLFHPVRDYLRGLEWDGIWRIDRWLEVICGAKAVEDKPMKGSGYLAHIGAKWLISAVARVMRPGCKADCAIVLEGPQGKRKSSALKVLGGDWFTDQLEAMRSKDASMQTHGVWIIEIGEMGSITKSEVEEVKAFMSRTVERYRPPYAGRLVDVPRQCIFAGTVNLEEYLQDDENRRFWPVECGDINLDALARERDQLWAEAYHRFKDGASWWLDDKEVIEAARLQTAARQKSDPWDEKIMGYLRGGARQEVTVTEILGPECLDIVTAWQEKTHGNRVAAILKRLGWKQHRARLSDGARPRVYRPYTDAARQAAATQQELLMSSERLL